MHATPIFPSNKYFIWPSNSSTLYSNSIYQGLFVSIFVLYLKKPLTLAFSIFYSIYLFSFYCMYMHVYVYSQTKNDSDTRYIFFY